MFDSFWNHETALPVAAFAQMPDDPAAALDALRERLAASRERIKDSEYAEAVVLTALEFVDSDTSMFEWSPYTLVYDSPDKGIKSKSGPSIAIIAPLIEVYREKPASNSFLNYKHAVSMSRSLPTHLPPTTS